MGWLSVLEILLAFFVRPVLIIQFGHSLEIFMGFRIKYYLLL